MVDVVPAGPLTRLTDLTLDPIPDPAQSGNMRDYLADHTLLRPDRAILCTNFFDQTQLALSTLEFHFYDPMTGHKARSVVKTSADALLTHSDIYLFRIDDDTAGFVGRTGYSAPRQAWLVGTVSWSGKLRYKHISYRTPTGPVDDFIHSKGAFYSYFNPSQGTVTVQDWVTYFSYTRNHHVPSECYGTTFSLDTLDIVGQQPLWAAQSEIDFQYYESFAMDDPQYLGGVGIEVNNGDGSYEKMTSLRLVNGARERIIDLPIGRDDYLVDAFIEQAGDDPSCLIVVWITSNETRILDPVYGYYYDQAQYNTRAAVFRVTPSFQTVRAPKHLGIAYDSYSYHGQPPNAPPLMQQGYNQNFYDQPHMGTTKILGIGTHSDFGASRYFAPYVQGMLTGFRSLVEADTGWKAYIIPTPPSGPITPGYYNNSTLSWPSYSGDYCLVAGNSGSQVDQFFQLLRILPRGVGSGRGDTRGAAFI